MSDTVWLPLSGSTDGKPIKIVAVASPGTLIHTACLSTATARDTTLDEVHLWVANQTAGAQTITVEWGGPTNPDDRTTTAYSVAINTLPFKLADGLVLRNGLTIKAFAGGGGANTLTVFGYVIRHVRTVYSGKVGGPT
jgi:hypothetical protein